MTCCIVGVLLTMAFVRVRRLFGRRPAPAPPVFAPVAWRPAPGQDDRAAALPRCEPAAAPVGRSPVLGYCALAIAAVGVGVPALAAAGVLQNTGSPAQWVARGVSYGIAVIAAVGLRRSTMIWRAPRGAGTLLVVAGAIVFELGVLDMHAFRVVGVDTANPLQLFVFHNVGPALAIAGGLVLGYGSLGRSSTSWRPSRSTETSAVPSSSAVTVSPTPPLTV